MLNNKGKHWKRWSLLRRATAYAMVAVLSIALAWPYANAPSALATSWVKVSNASAITKISQDNDPTSFSKAMVLSFDTLGGSVSKCKSNISFNSNWSEASGSSDTGSKKWRFVKKETAGSSPVDIYYICVYKNPNATSESSYTPSGGKVFSMTFENCGKIAGYQTDITVTVSEITISAHYNNSNSDYDSNGWVAICGVTSSALWFGSPANNHLTWYGQREVKYNIKVTWAEDDDDGAFEAGDTVNMRKYGGYIAASDIDVNSSYKNPSGSKRTQINETVSFKKENFSGFTCYKGTTSYPSRLETYNGDTWRKFRDSTGVGSDNKDLYQTSTSDGSDYLQGGVFADIDSTSTFSCYWSGPMASTRFELYCTFSTIDTPSKYLLKGYNTSTTTKNTDDRYTKTGNWVTYRIAQKLPLLYSSTYKTLDSLTITDTIPDGLTKGTQSTSDSQAVFIYYGLTNDTCTSELGSKYFSKSWSGQTLTVTFENLDDLISADGYGGMWISIVITCQVDDDAADYTNSAGFLVNTATTKVKFDGASSTASMKTNKVRVGLADINTEKTVGPSTSKQYDSYTFEANDTMYWQVTYTNEGSATLEDIVIYDRNASANTSPASSFPAGLTLDAAPSVSSTDSSSGVEVANSYTNASETAQGWRVTADQLASGKSITVTFTTTAPVVYEDTEYENATAAKADYVIGNGNTGSMPDDDASATATVTAYEADLEDPVKTVNTPIANEGDKLTYTVSWTTALAAPSDSVSALSIYDDVPEGVSVTSASVTKDGTEIVSSDVNSSSAFDIYSGVLDATDTDGWDWWVVYVSGDYDAGETITWVASSFLMYITLTADISDGSYIGFNGNTSDYGDEAVSTFSAGNVNGATVYCFSSWNDVEGYGTNAETVSNATVVGTVTDVDTDTGFDTGTSSCSYGTLTVDTDEVCFTFSSPSSSSIWDGSTWTLTWTATVDEYTSKVTNTAYVYLSDSSGDTTLSSNTVTTVVPDINITKEVSDPENGEYFTVGEEMHWTVTVANSSSTTTLTSVTVSDVLPYDLAVEGGTLVATYTYSESGSDDVTDDWADEFTIADDGGSWESCSFSLSATTSASSETLTITFTTIATEACAEACLEDGELVDLDDSDVVNTVSATGTGKAAGDGYSGTKGLTYTADASSEASAKALVYDEGDPVEISKTAEVDYSYHTHHESGPTTGATADFTLSGGEYFYSYNYFLSCVRLANDWDAGQIAAWDSGYGTTLYVQSSTSRSCAGSWLVSAWSYDNDTVDPDMLFIVSDATVGEWEEMDVLEDSAVEDDDTLTHLETTTTIYAKWVASGSTVTWTIVISMTDSTGYATNLTVTDNVRERTSAFTLKSATIASDDTGSASISTSGNTWTLTADRLEDEQAITVTLKTSVAEGYENQYLYNYAYVTCDQNSDSDMDCVMTYESTEKIPELSITKTANVTPTTRTGAHATRLGLSGTSAKWVQVGEQFTWTVTVDNVGDAGSVAEDTTVTDTVPDQLSLDAVSARAGSTALSATTSGNSWTVYVGDLDTDTTVTVTLTTTALEACDTAVTNTAYASASNADEVSDSDTVYVYYTGQLPLTGSWQLPAALAAAAALAGAGAALSRRRKTRGRGAHSRC